MKALIFQTMLALLIPGLSNTPKQALTPPTNYDYSLRYFIGEEYDDWYFGTKTTAKQSIAMSAVGVNNSYISMSKVFSWTYQYPLGTTYGALVLDFTFHSTSIAYYSDYFGNSGYRWVSNSMNGGTSYNSYVKIQNNSPFNVKMYVDNSSRGSTNSFYLYYYETYSTDNRYQQYIIWNSASGYGTFYIPPLTTIYCTSNETKLDAIYFDVLSIPSSLTDYAEDYRDIGYGEGYLQAADDYGNWTWLNSLFTTMGELLAIEILPGISIGLILLIPIVFGVLRFIMGLFR